MKNVTEDKIKFISIKNHKKIGKGMFSKVFLLNDDAIVKVIAKKMPFEDILYEYEISQKAYSLGIPCPKTYEIVRTELGYGIVGERIKGKTLNKYLKKHPDECEIYAKKYAELLKKINSINVDKSEIKSIVDIYKQRLENAKKHFSKNQMDFINKILDRVPEKTVLLHGDPRLTNVMITDEGELKFIDLDNVSYGNPIYDLSGVCYTLYVMTKRHGSLVKIANGMNYKNSFKFWNIFLQHYLNTEDKNVILEYEKISEIIARLREISYLKQPKQSFGYFVDAYILLVKNKFFKNPQETLERIKKLYN